MNDKYECSNCERRYTSLEYDTLDRQQVNPDEDNPGRGGGYETVCKCGAGFHTDKWQTNTELDVDDETIYIVTYGLNLSHGIDHDRFYETMVYHPKTDHIADRYPTKDDAIAGHEHVVELIRDEQFRLEPAAWRLVLEEDDD